MSDEQTYPEPPEGIRPLSNGAGYDTERKRITHGPGTFGHDPARITVENNAEYQAARYESGRLAAEQAIATGTNSPDAWGGWFTVVAAQTQLALNTEKGRASTEAAKFVGRAADLLPQQVKGQPTNQTNVQINVTQDALLDILGTTGGNLLDIDDTST